MAATPLPNNDHSISLPIAMEMTKRYRDNKEVILANEFKGNNVLPISETFNKEAFLPFITNSEVKGIRIYYGMKDDLTVHAIVIGVNENNEDLLPSLSDKIITDTDDDFEILEEAQRCPPLCPSDSPLNTP